MIVVGPTHALARSLSRTGALDYAMTGAAVGVATDPNALVAEDHPSREAHAIAFNG